jgi:hypothetical protein
MLMATLPHLAGTVSQGTSTHLPMQSYYSNTQSYNGLPYDEQIGVSFVQDFSSLTFNVTAVAQTGPDGNGPGYLLSALTDGGYWYQVGVSYKWPDTNGSHLSGFAMNYEVFNYFGRSVYPVDGGGGIQDMTVHSGDNVLLSLNFTSDGSNVVMTAYDWNLQTSAQQSYPAYGSYFVGTPNHVAENGFFTGLMTEQYYSTPFRSTGQVVMFTDNGFNYSSAWLWIDEFNTATNRVVFVAQTPSPVNLASSTTLWPGYLSSNGTAVAANQHTFVTGLHPVNPVTVRAVASATVHPGSIATINLTITNSNQGSSKLTDVTVTTDFGTYTLNDTIDVSPGTTSHQVTIQVPNSVTNGNHAVTVHAVSQAYDSDLNQWVSQGSLQSTATLLVTGGTSTPKTPSGNTQNTPTVAGFQSTFVKFLPAILAIIAAAIILPFVILTINRKNKTQTLAMQPYPLQYVHACSRCGQSVDAGMIYCPNCGVNLHGNGSSSPVHPTFPTVTD